MITSKIFSALAFIGAIFLSSTAATSLPSLSRKKCYKCPPKVIVRVYDKKSKSVPFDLVSEDRSQGALECFYKNKKDDTQQTFCTYELDNGDIITDGDGFCPHKAVTETGSHCKGA